MAGQWRASPLVYAARNDFDVTLQVSSVARDALLLSSEFPYYAPKLIWLARNFKMKGLKDAEGQN
ncbi:unnamed protein product [Peronospora destructor]|uniref:Uncharacterized protein n=1 Tax=Peronospora destructor TaxID=86335 RepID=A0AAV0SYI5_9STRA|nr:unnamed protein product [Peronospora destructor]